jgi:PilZ domain-containing protein
VLLTGSPITPDVAPMPTASERRRESRLEREIPLEIRFGSSLVGTTANVSDDGVFFVARGPLTVEVRLGKGRRARVVRGRIVRVDSRDASHSELGLAVRFDE